MESAACFDIIVIGSGPCGAMAATDAVNTGARVLTVDFGTDDPDLRELVPDLPFEEIRRSDHNQARYLIGENLEGVPTQGIKVGAQLTPPRQFVSRHSQENLPIQSDTFQPMQSLGLGGLGAAWGAACFTYTEKELLKIGLAPFEFQQFYNRVAARIGISGPIDGEIEAAWWAGIQQHQPPLEIDLNARTILAVYGARQAKFHRAGLRLGRIPLAVLSRDLGNRRANPYFDMDFYSDSRRSVFRPRYVFEELKSKPNFTYRGGFLALRFEETGDQVTLYGRTRNGLETVRGRRLLICAGAINSARLVLNSLSLRHPRTHVLCNGYTYFPSINLRTFGKPNRDKRYSLAQLHAFLQDGSDLADNCSVQIYSYRSLLLFKLVKETPLPPWLGLQCARTLVNSLTIFGAFFADAPDETKYIEIHKPLEDQLPALNIHYQLNTFHQERRRRIETSLRKQMRRLGCIPIGRIDPGNAGSIHYAGTLPFNNSLCPELSTQPDFRLARHRNVFIGDSSSWNWLPSKGLTFTAMASASRIAQQVAASL